MFKTKPLLTLQSKKLEPLKQNILSRTPIQIHGLIDHWTARSWTFELLKEKLGDRTVKVLLELPKSGGVLEGGQESYEKKMTFGDFVEKIHNNNGSPCYMGYSRANDFLQTYQNSYDFSPLTIPSKHDTDTRLWIGSAGTCSGLHTDLKDNIFAQIVGKKRVFLVPFNQTHLVHPFIDNIVNSQVDPDHYDFKKYPNFAKADVYSTIVGPGDVLFIPRGWWHYLRSESPSISINHWFGPPVSSLTYLGLLARLGPSYISRTFVDMVRYGILGKKYRKEFFFTPQSTGERLLNLIRYGNFSKENDPVTDTKKEK
jgi:lysine-specific demethylase 8